MLCAVFCCASCRRAPDPEQIRLFETPTSESGFFPRAKPEAVGIHPAALSALVAEAQAAHSHALIVVKDGRVVAERYFGHDGRRPLRVNSVTKSVVSLGVGLLIRDGKIPGLSTPIARWYPEWAKDERAKITLWNILTHTSALYHEQSAETLYRQPDVLRYVAGLRATGVPGSFSYSNEAVALLPGIVRAASGVPLDGNLKEHLFEPMEITAVDWDRDQAGNVLAFGGLWLLPRDLARIGQLMADAGRWNDRQLVPASWVKASISPARNDIRDYGLLWWLYPGRRQPGGDAGANAQVPESAAAPAGFGADGWLGQYLIVYPEWRLVAVRLHGIERGNNDSENRKYGMRSFRELVTGLVKK